jgi:hypothetical protein
MIRTNKILILHNDEIYFCPDKLLYYVDSSLHRKVHEIYKNFVSENKLKSTGFAYISILNISKHYLVQNDTIIDLEYHLQTYKKYKIMSWLILGNIRETFVIDLDIKNIIVFPVSYPTLQIKTLLNNIPEHINLICFTSKTHSMLTNLPNTIKKIIIDKSEINMVKIPFGCEQLLL